MKKVVVLLLALCMMFSLLPMQSFATESSDMSVDEFRTALAAAVENGTELILDKNIVLQENMDISLERIVLVNGAQFAVANGVTVSIDGLFWVRNGELNVNPGGTLDITPSSRVIFGAEGLVMDGTRYETSGGSVFNMAGTLFCGGTIMVVPDASMWIPSGGTAHIDGMLSNVGPVHVLENGTMEVTGRLNCKGYLAVHPNGSLNTTSASVVDVVMDGMHNGYLDNTGNVILRGSVNLSGLCTTSKDSETGEGNGTMEIWDANIDLSETSSLGVLAGGCLTLNNSTLSSNGLITVEKDAALWVNNDSKANINAEMENLGYVHVGFEGSGALNVNGNLDNNGYLAIHPSSTFNVSNNGTLNILNDENGCGYLDNGGVADLNGTVNLDGLCSTNNTLDLDGTMNASETSSIFVNDGGAFNVNGVLNGGGEIVVEKEGELNIAGDVSVDLSMKNEGTILVQDGGRLTTNGTWEGNAAVDQGDEVQDNVPSVPMFRMYDPNSSEHFYTGSEEEREILVEAGWNYEGVGFNFPIKGEPVHRLYHEPTGEHLYTMDEAEMNSLLAAGWNYEGVAFNSAGTDEVAQYRLHNPNATRGAYHFTGSTEERDWLISLGWENQGIGWYSCLR